MEVAARFQHFSTVKEITEWSESRTGESSPVLYLIDFQLIGQEKNGLEIIESLAIEENAILVTSRDEDRKIVEKCLHLGVRLIPKSLAAFVPIDVMQVDGPDREIDLVLIDDDPITHLNWRNAAKQAGKRLKGFWRPEVFFKIAGNLNRSIPIYIDSELGDSVKGELVAKEISAMGFEHIILTTGHASGKFRDMPWLKAVMAKEPPWT